MFDLQDEQAWTRVVPPLAGAAAGPRGSTRVRVEVTEHGGHVVVAPGGELDTASVERLSQAIRAAFEGGRRLVVLDLAAVTFIDSTAVSALLREHGRAQDEGLSLRLAAAPGAVDRVLEMLGVAGALPVHGTVAEAVAG